MSPARPPQRVAAVDALRALALLPVVAVNWGGYGALPDMGPMSPPTPAGSVLAEAVSWFMHALIAGKGISLLAFLFGYSQGLSQDRGEAGLARRRRRLGKLLLLGVLSGKQLRHASRAVGVEPRQRVADDRARVARRRPAGCAARRSAMPVRPGWQPDPAPAEAGSHPQSRQRRRRGIRPTW